MSKAKTKKSTELMSNETCADLKESFGQVLEYVRGERKDLRTTRAMLPAPPKPMSKAKILKLRQQLNCSQTVFARLLNVSPKTVQAWEQGVRKPSETALKLLNIAAKDPQVLWIN
jgi:putative transcriptional regulator